MPLGSLARWSPGIVCAEYVLRERLQEARLQIAILGQFKRGKSTFINALLRAPLLPSAVVPVTAIPTFIAWGAVPHIRVTYRDTRPPEDFHPPDPVAVRAELNQWVTEQGNPVNRRQVRRVDLFFPADVLRDGMVLIDTPGVGSTLRHNTDAALQVLPECDAALFVVSADPPITEAEIAYLRAIRPHVVRLHFVLNKIDYLNGPEQEQATAFLRNALRGSFGSAEEPRNLSAFRARCAASRGGRQRRRAGRQRVATYRTRHPASAPRRQAERAACLRCREGEDAAGAGPGRAEPAAARAGTAAG